MRSRKVDPVALLSAREAAGLTQEHVAKKLKVDRSAVSRWESGETQPTAANFKALRKLYKTAPESLLVSADDQAA